MSAVEIERPARPPLFCSYLDGMFAHEPLGEGIGAWWSETMATRYHEAGHAVVGYALGMGCTSIEIKESYDIYDGKLGVAVGGRVQGAPSIGKRLKKQIEKGAWCRATLIHGVNTCAGPAAERKYRILNDQPMDMLGAIEGDHNNIDNVGKTNLARIRPMQLCLSAALLAAGAALS